VGGNWRFDPHLISEFSMGLFHFLIVLQGLVAASLVGIILMQKSEGGGLTSGGSPSGLMSARSAADFLTRSTSILATAFILLSVSLAFVAAREGGGTKVDDSFKRNEAPAPVTAPADPAAVPVTAPATPATGGIPLDK
jgi:preprotein translocase subunit SecG